MTITDGSVYSQTHSRFCDSSHSLRPKWKDEKDSVLNWILLYLKNGWILTSNHRLSIFCASFPLSLFFSRIWERQNFALILPRTATTNTLWMLKNWKVIYKNIVLEKLRLNLVLTCFKQPGAFWRFEAQNFAHIRSKLYISYKQCTVISNCNIYRRP